jgi:uncharacterized protein
MKFAYRFALFTTFSVMWSGAFTLAAETSSTKEKTAMEFESYFLVFLKSGANAEKFEPADLEKLQAAHLAHLSKMWHEGYALIAGPFDPPKGSDLRGMVIYRGDLSEDKVRQLAENDPAVKAGRLRVEVIKWFVEKGYLLFPIKPEANDQPTENK